MPDPDFWGVCFHIAPTLDIPPPPNVATISWLNPLLNYDVFNSCDACKQPDKVQILENCDDDEDIICLQNTLALGTFVQYNGKCYEVKEVDSCDATIPITYSTGLYYKTCESCKQALPQVNYALINCDTGDITYTSTDLSAYVTPPNQAITINGSDACFQVRVEENIPPGTPVTVTDSFLSCELCGSDYYLLKACPSDDTIESIDIITGVNNTVDRTVEAVNKAVDAVGNYVEKIYDQNKALVEAQNQAKLAAAQQAKLAEQYDRDAELLRQTRDEERNSIQDRINANNTLNDTLNKQEDAMLANANAQILAAKLAYNLNKTIDNKVALLSAEANKEGVLAKIAGLRSEQKMNDLALNKEYNEMLKAQSQATAELNVNSTKFAADQIKNEIERIKAQRQALEAESTIQLERLKLLIDSYNKGTQARVDAENEYAAKKQEIEQNLALKDRELREAELNRLNEITQIRIGLIQGAEQQALAQLEFEYEQKFRLAQGDADKIVALEDEKQKKLKAIKHTALMAEMQMASDGLNALMALNDALPKKTEQQARRSFQINKALQLAQATMSGVQSVMAVMADPTLVGPTRYIAAAIAGVTAVASIAKIASTKFESGASGGGTPLEANLGSFSQGGGGGMAPGLTAQNNVTQLNPDGTIAGQGQQQPAPIKAYVVESESRAVTDRVNKLSNQSKIG